MIREGLKDPITTLTCLGSSDSKIRNRKILGKKFGYHLVFVSVQLFREFEYVNYLGSGLVRI